MDEKLVSQIPNKLKLHIPPLIKWVALSFLTPVVGLIFAFCSNFIFIPVGLVLENILPYNSLIKVFNITGIFISILLVLVFSFIYAIFQWFVLAEFGLKFKCWLTSTTIGILVSSFISFLVVVMGDRFLNLTFHSSSPFFGILLGLIFGSGLGFAQSFPVRSITNKYNYWVWANAIAYACGISFFQFIWIAAIMESEGAGIFLWCLLPFSSTIVGCIMGLFLVWPINLFKRTH